MATLYTQYNDNTHFNTNGSVSFSNGAVCDYSGDTITYTRAVKITSIPWRNGSAHSGRVYWHPSGSTARYYIGYISSDGAFNFYSSIEQIDLPTSGNSRVIDISYEPSSSSQLTVYFGSPTWAVSFTDDRRVARTNQLSYGTRNYSEDIVLWYDEVEFESGSDFTGTVYWGTYSGATTYKIGEYKNGEYVLSSAGSLSDRTVSFLGYDRTIYITAIPSSPVFYWKYRWLKHDGTVIATELYNHQKEEEIGATGTQVTLSTIPTYGNYKKTGNYSNVAHCTIYKGLDYAFCTSKDSADPSIIGVEVTDTVDLFYWFGNETTDANNIRQGYPRTMTATMWNSFLSKIEELGRACSSPVSITRVRQGNPMLASQYTAARNALSTIKNSNTIFRTVSLPQAVDSGDGVNASQFQGSTSIKQCLNNLIDRWNA